MSKIPGLGLKSKLIAPSLKLKGPGRKDALESINHESANAEPAKDVTGPSEPVKSIPSRKESSGICQPRVNSSVSKPASLHKQSPYSRENATTSKIAFKKKSAGVSVQTSIPGHPRVRDKSVNAQDESAKENGYRDISSNLKPAVDKPPARKELVPPKTRIGSCNSAVPKTDTGVATFGQLSKKGSASLQNLAGSATKKKSSTSAPVPRSAKLSSSKSMQNLAHGKKNEVPESQTSADGKIPQYPLRKFVSVEDNSRTAASEIDGNVDGARPRKLAGGIPLPRSGKLSNSKSMQNLLPSKVKEEPENKESAQHGISQYPLRKFVSVEDNSHTEHEHSDSNKLYGKATFGFNSKRTNTLKIPVARPVGKFLQMPKSGLAKPRAVSVPVGSSSDAKGKTDTSSKSLSPLSDTSSQRESSLLIDQQSSSVDEVDSRAHGLETEVVKVPQISNICTSLGPLQSTPVRKEGGYSFAHISEERPPQNFVADPFSLNFSPMKTEHSKISDSSGSSEQSQPALNLPRKDLERTFDLQSGHFFDNDEEKNILESCTFVQDKPTASHMHSKQTSVEHENIELDTSMKGGPVNVTRILDSTYDCDKKARVENEINAKLNITTTIKDLNETFDIGGTIKNTESNKDKKSKNELEENGSGGESFNVFDVTPPNVDVSDFSPWRSAKHFIGNCTTREEKEEECAELSYDVISDDEIQQLTNSDLKKTGDVSITSKEGSFLTSVSSKNDTNTSLNKPLNRNAVVTSLPLNNEQSVGMIPLETKHKVQEETQKGMCVPESDEKESSVVIHSSAVKEALNAPQEESTPLLCTKHETATNADVKEAGNREIVTDLTRNSADNATITAKEGEQNRTEALPKSVVADDVSFTERQKSMTLPFSSKKRSLTVGLRSHFLTPDQVRVSSQRRKLGLNDSLTSSLLLKPPSRDLLMLEDDKGNITMDKWSYIQLQHEIKTMKTALLKLKRSLQEVDILSPLSEKTSSSYKRALFDPVSGTTSKAKRPVLRAKSYSDANAWATSLAALSSILSPTTESDARQTPADPIGTSESSTDDKKETTNKEHKEDVLEKVKVLEKAKDELEHELECKNNTIHLLQTQLDGCQFVEEREELLEQNIILQEEVQRLTEELQMLSQDDNDKGLRRKRSGSTSSIKDDFTKNLDSKSNAKVGMLKRMYSHDAGSEDDG